jgi:hypothetical protein
MGTVLFDKLDALIRLLPELEEPIHRGRDNEVRPRNIANVNYEVGVSSELHSIDRPSSLSDQFDQYIGLLLLSPYLVTATKLMASLCM